MSNATVTRDLIVAQTRALKMPGIARVFDSLAAKRAMPTGRMRNISTRCSAPSKALAMSRSFASGCVTPGFPT